MGAIVRAALFVSLVVTFSISSGAAGRMVGGRTEVKDVEANKEVQNLGKFCVEEFNKKQVGSGGGRDGGVGKKLAFSRVVAAETQIVSGIKYFLRIEVTMYGGERRMFDSVVVVKPWVHSRELVHFAPAYKTPLINECIYVL